MNRVYPSNFELRSERLFSRQRFLSDRGLFRTTGATPSIALPLPAAQLREIPEKVGIYVFHLLVAVSTIALHVAVLACRGYQAHEHLPPHSYVKVFVLVIRRDGDLTPLIPKVHVNLQLTVLDYIPNAQDSKEEGLGPEVSASVQDRPSRLSFLERVLREMPNAFAARVLFPWC